MRTSRLNGAIIDFLFTRVIHKLQVYFTLAIHVKFSSCLLVQNFIPAYYLSGIWDYDDRSRWLTGVMVDISELAEMIM